MCPPDIHSDSMDLPQLFVRLHDVPFFRGQVRIQGLVEEINVSKFVTLVSHREQIEGLSLQELHRDLVLSNHNILID